MKKLSVFVSSVAISALGVSGFLFSSVLTAHADSIGPIDFEPSSTPGYVLGSINGQNGWGGDGIPVNPTYDQGVATTTVPGFGTQAFRMSDAVTSGSFGDWVFAPPLTNAVGESDSTDGGFSAGTLQPHFDLQFDIASTQATEQPGLHVSVSPDRGDGSRMSYLRFEDATSGINVFFDDVQGTSSPANFVETEVATGLDRTIGHHIELAMDTLDGPSNDVVKVYVDGVLVHTGTSWENYYRYDAEASAEQSPRIVKTIIIQARGNADPGNQGKGFLFDNISYSSGPIPTPPPSTVTVTIDKFIDGKMANATSAGNSSFPMMSSWNAVNIGAGTGSYDLGTDDAYQAVTADMTTGASYATNEVTGGAAVGANCTTGQPYSLVGYSTGTSLAAAASSTVTTTSPNFANLTSDEFVVVWNKACLPSPVNVFPADGATLTSASWTIATWTGVTDAFPPISYIYESSNSSSTNPDGSFVTPAYTSGVLSTSSIPTGGTPEGTWFWHARAVDADGNMSGWSAPTEVIVNNTPPVFLKVHILKYLDGAEATASSSNSYLFPMVSTWQTANLDGGATSSGSYPLGNNFGGASELYGADTAPMLAPANYTTSEVTNDQDASSKVLPEDATCVAGDYELAGYQTSAVSFADALTQPTTNDAPAFTNLNSDQYVVVKNITCPTTATLTVEKDSIGGVGTFNLTGDNGIGSFQITTIGTSTQGGTGSVTFNDLAPGTYHITEIAPSGWTQTDNTCSIVLGAGDNKLCTIVNTKNTKLGEIRGVKYEDRDGDGNLTDGDHHRLAGWTFYLDTNNNGVLDAGEPTAVSDSHGAYHFVGLVAGTYHVREVGQPGWIETYPSAGGEYTITLAAGQIAKNKNFGNFHLGTISGMKFYDKNGDSRKDNGETGLANWTIKITGPHGFTATTVTDANGNYSFTNLGPGTYKVTEVQQSGWQQTTKNPAPITIYSGENDKGVDFGNDHPGDGRHNGYYNGHIYWYGH